MAPEVEADPTVAGAMRGLSALRLLSHHLQGLAEVSLGVDVSDWRDDPVLRIQLHQQGDGAEVTRLADSLGLSTPVSVVGSEGEAYWSTEGLSHGYEVRLSTVVLPDPDGRDG